MKIRSGLMFAAVTLFVTGCASTPQQPVSLSHHAVGSTAGRIGVAMTALPKLDTQVPGADCLLCLAVASSANSALTTHAQTLPYEELPRLKNRVADMLRKRGVVATIIEEEINLKDFQDIDSKEPNLARKDFSPLQQKYRIDRLLVIDITALGFIRTYAAYIPTSDPKGMLRGTGYIVNLKNNAYDWYLPVSVTKSVDRNWDEPPKFPGLTNAYFQALEIGMDSFLRPFSGDAVAAVSPKIVSSPTPTTTVAGTPGQSTRQ